MPKKKKVRPKKKSKAKKKAKKKPNKSNKSNTIKRVAQNKAKVLKALSRSHGIIKDACKAGKISRVTFYEWKNTDKEFSSGVHEILEDQIDEVESQLLKGIRKGKETSQIFFLKCKAKNRGYVDRSEIKPVSEEPIDLSIFTTQELREMAEINDRANARAKKSASAA